MQLTPVQQAMVQNNRARAIMKRKLLDERAGLTQHDARLDTDQVDKRMKQVYEGATVSQNNAEIDTEQVDKAVKEDVECIQGLQDELVPDVTTTSQPGFPYFGIMCCVCARVVCIFNMLNSKCHTIQMSGLRHSMQRVRVCTYMFAVQMSNMICN